MCQPLHPLIPVDCSGDNRLDYSGACSMFSWDNPRTQEALVRLFGVRTDVEVIKQVVVTPEGIKAYFSPIANRQVAT